MDIDNDSYCYALCGLSFRPDLVCDLVSPLQYRVTVVMGSFCLPILMRFMSMFSERLIMLEEFAKFSSLVLA